MTVCNDMLKTINFIQFILLSSLDKATPKPVDAAKTTDHISLCTPEVTGHILKDNGKC